VDGVTAAMWVASTAVYWVSAGVEKMAEQLVYLMAVEMVSKWVEQLAHQ